MEITISSACLSKEEFLLKGKLLWMLLNRYKETNIKIFGFWFGLLLTLLFLAYTISEFIEKTESAIIILGTGIGYIYYLTTFYSNKIKYFNHLKTITKNTAELEPFEIYVNDEKVAYKDSKQQFSYTWENVQLFTLYKDNIFILFDRSNLQQSIIIGRKDVSEQEFEELANFIDKK